MIIKEIDNITYQINLPNSNINIYNKDSLERITKKIFKKIKKNRGVTGFLYKIDYFTINNHSNSSIYYYKNNYYLKPKKNINKKEYLKLLEASEIIYDNYEEIINKGIKINI